MNPRDKLKAQYTEKLRLVRLAITMWEKLDEDSFGQIAHDYCKESLIELCKVYNNKGKCKISDSDSGKCPIYKYSGKKCFSRDNYKKWIDHHDREHAGDLRFVSCKICEVLKKNELELLKEVESYLERRLNNPVPGDVLLEQDQNGVIDKDLPAL
jgi:hypothetical protein